MHQPEEHFHEQFGSVGFGASALALLVVLFEDGDVLHALARAVELGGCHVILDEEWIHAKAARQRFGIALVGCVVNEQQVEEQAEKQPLFTLEDYSRNENDSNVGDNDYLNEYIREVKQYNMEQGNAVSEETSLNILQQINEIQKPQKQEPVSRPYARQTKKRNDTADIPFMSPFRSDDDSENTEKIFEDDAANAESEEPKSREDIMAEVQSLVNGKPPVQRSITVDDDLYSSIEDDRTTRQRLLNETTQMRAQLDGYEDNLSEVNDKMRYTNRILNLVLVVLIIALVVMLFILIYWVVLSRGA